MAHHDQCCPYADTCDGVIVFSADVICEPDIEQCNGETCIVTVAVTCTVLAQCNRCSFSEILSRETQHLNFVQFYGLETSATNEEFDAHIAEMKALYAETA